MRSIRLYYKYFYNSTHIVNHLMPMSTFEDYLTRTIQHITWWDCLFHAWHNFSFTRNGYPEMLSYDTVELLASLWTKMIPWIVLIGSLFGIKVINHKCLSQWSIIFLSWRLPSTWDHSLIFRTLLEPLEAHFLVSLPAK